MHAELPSTASAFNAPPLVRTARGETRTAGFELEYAGLSIEKSATIIQDIFNGKIEVESTFVHHVHTPAGKFSVEIDAAVLKNKLYEKPLRAIGLDPDQHDLTWLESTLLSAAAAIVPIEISAPPVGIDRLDPLDTLRDRLREAGAQGTRAALVYAFGCHINPQIVDPRDIASLRDHLRAIILLHPWLKQMCEVDLARRATPYINPFPIEYARLILRPEYQPDQNQFIDDYLMHNPTRNRPLDMTPTLAWLDRQRVIGRVAEMDLVKPRPTFHYRLPNCMIDETNWTLAREWNTWVIVERLAQDRAALARMSWEFLDADRESIRPFVDHWPQKLQRHLKGLLAG